MDFEGMDDPPDPKPKTYKTMLIFLGLVVVNGFVGLFLQQLASTLGFLISCMILTLMADKAIKKRLKVVLMLSGVMLLTTTLLISVVSMF